MDSRVYFHQYRRPRYNNPTYVSNNVNSSLSFYQDKSYINPKSHNTYTGLEVNDKSGSYSLHKPVESNMRQRYHTINATLNGQVPLVNEHVRYNSTNRNGSNLSSYGSNSLSLNQSDIYNKQNSKFNIITMKPKQFDISIRQHPKYTLQNKDQLYYKRMTEELQKKAVYDQIYNSKKSSNNTNDFIAGKHTYQTERQKLARININQGNSQNPQAFNQYYKQQHVSLGNHKPLKQFTPKLLNHMDQLISLS